MAIIKVGKNGPKIWGYSRINDKFVSFWGSNGNLGGTDEKASEAYFANLWKQKTLNSGGFKPISEDELRTLMPTLPEEFFN